ncbi:MAG: hypothetical protein KF784_12520 [Fimbriimonadaceae bacterium]|nr:hypothetical protein [Fimbriimonadaceae bacterium]
MMKIAKPWDAQKMASMADPYSANPMVLEKAQKIAVAYEKEFGALVSIKGDINSYTDLLDAGGSFSEAEYIGEALFEKSQAQVLLILTKRGSNWYLESVSVMGPNSTKGSL